MRDGRWEMDVLAGFFFLAFVSVFLLKVIEILMMMLKNDVVKCRPML